jgi:hypothetical protein
VIPGGSGNREFENSRHDENLHGPEKIVAS